MSVAYYLVDKELKKEEMDFREFFYSLRSKFSKEIRDYCEKIDGELINLGRYEEIDDYRIRKLYCAEDDSWADEFGVLENGKFHFTHDDNRHKIFSVKELIKILSENDRYCIEDENEREISLDSFLDRFFPDTF